MAFVKNDNIQMNLCSSYYGLTQREQKLLSNSWAEGFHNDIFPNINEERFSVLYSDNPASRPNSPTNVALGLLILKEMGGLSDEAAYESLLFDVRYQYALHTDSFLEQPISKNTLSNFRCLVYSYYEQTGTDLIKEEVKALAARHAFEMDIAGNLIRMDSLMIAGKSRSLSRLELIFQCVSRLAKVLYALCPEEMPQNFSQYLEEGYRNKLIYHETGAKIEEKMEVLLRDALELKKIAEAREEIMELKETRHLFRLLEEQTQTDVEGMTVWIDKRNVSADSMQNPTDEDMTYRKKAGKDYVGYVGNVVESFSREGNSIITDYDFQKNTYSDITFCKDFIIDQAECKEKKQVIVDGAYYSEEADRLAAEKNIELIPTNMTGRKDGGGLAGEFIIDRQTHEIEECPAGNKPIDNSYKNGRYQAHMEKEDCEGCSYRNECPLEEQKKKNRILIYESTLNLAEKSKVLGQEEYRELGNKRAGVEGIPSLLRNHYGIDNMPVLGKVRSKIWYGLKIAAINAKKRIVFAQ